MFGKLARRIGAEVNARARQLIRAQPRPVHTITVDNGTEFQAYKQLEATCDTRFYFATRITRGNAVRAAACNR